MTTFHCTPRDLSVNKRHFLFSGTDELRLTGIAVDMPVSVAFQADLQ
jgi:hypothetical protein